MQPPMTIEERDTARAIHAIARDLKKPARPKEIDWEQRKWELAKEIFAGGFNCPDGDVRHWIGGHVEMTAEESIHYAEVFIEEYKRSQTNKPE